MSTVACTICSDVLTSPPQPLRDVYDAIEGVAALRCGHTFHKACIHRWFGRRAAADRSGRADPSIGPCPLCNVEAFLGDSLRLFPSVEDCEHCLQLQDQVALVEFWKRTSTAKSTKIADLAKRCEEKDKEAAGLRLKQVENEENLRIQNSQIAVIRNTLAEQLDDLAKLRTAEQDERRTLTLERDLLTKRLEEMAQLRTADRQTMNNVAEELANLQNTLSSSSGTAVDGKRRDWTKLMKTFFLVGIFVGLALLLTAFLFFGAKTEKNSAPSYQGQGRGHGHGQGQQPFGGENVDDDELKLKSETEKPYCTMIRRKQGQDEGQDQGHGEGQGQGHGEGQDQGQDEGQDQGHGEGQGQGQESLGSDDDEELMPKRKPQPYFTCTLQGKRQN